MEAMKTRPVGPEDPFPVPTGTYLYDSLAAKIVDFRKLLEALAESAYSGYLRFLSADATALLLLRNGRPIDCCWRAEEVVRGDQARQLLEARIADGIGVLDIVGVAPEVVDGLHHAASGASVYPELHGSWVRLEGLIKFLETRHFTGSVTVRARDGFGVILCTGGIVAGGYTSHSPAMKPDAAEVLRYGEDGEARIELRGSTEPSLAYGDATNNRLKVVG